MKIAKEHVGMVVLALALGVAGTLTSGCSQFEHERRCGEMMFRRDPGSGSCRPMLACSADDGLTPDWGDCADPCAGLGQSACNSDPRCQAVMRTSAQPLPGDDQPGFGSGSGFFSSVDAGMFFPGSGDGGVPFPTPPPSPAPLPSRYAGCSPVAQPRSCDELSAGECGRNPTCEVVGTLCACSTGFGGPDGGMPPLQCNLVGCVMPGEQARCQVRSCHNLVDARSCGARADCAWDGVQCGARSALPCAGLPADLCQQRRDCRVVGSQGFCPPYMTCTGGEAGGFFQACEPDPNAQQGCRSDGECGPGARCQQPAGCSPLEPGCVSRCVMAAGCSGLDQARCSALPGCAPRFQAVCVPPPGTPANQQPQPGSPYDPGSAPGAAPPCVPTQAFVGCQDLSGEIVPDRSIAIMDPVVLDQPRYSIGAMANLLAGGGNGNLLLSRAIESLSAPQTINGRVVSARPLVTELANISGTGGQGSTLDRLRFRPVAIMNRLDLVSAEDCGEARIVFASDLGALSPAHRMTLIMEFGVPADGQGCRTWATQWVKLSQISTSSPDFAQRLALLTDQLFRAERLNQLRTNELMVGGFMRQDWQLREFHLVDGALVPHPVANTPAQDAAQAPGLPAFFAWLRANQVAVALGSAKVPLEFLAPQSTALPADRLSLPPEFADLEGALNFNTCAGCHRTETATDFVHVAERRFLDGRAITSVFLRQEIPKRARILQQLLGDSAPANILRTRPRPVVH